MLTRLFITKFKVISSDLTSQSLVTTCKEDEMLYAHVSFTSARINILIAHTSPK